jgi:hypothetical protein
MGMYYIATFQTQKHMHPFKLLETRSIAYATILSCKFPNGVAGWWLSCFFFLAGMNITSYFYFAQRNKIQ